jgi:hypothetical protein
MPQFSLFLYFLGIRVGYAVNFLSVIYLMDLVFKIQSKAFGYNLPFWRKIQFNLKLENQNFKIQKSTCFNDASIFTFSLIFGVMLSFT